MISANSHETNHPIDYKEGWTKVITVETKVEGQRLKVMIHIVRINKTETSYKERALAELHAENPQPKDKVQFCKLTWKKWTLIDGKLHRLLLVDIGTPVEENTRIEEGLLYIDKPKYYVLFQGVYILTQCFKCYFCGPIAVTCQRPQTCRSHTKEHPSAACPTANNLRTYFCSNCKEGLHSGKG
jgi:hypothetical protein